MNCWFCRVLVVALAMTVSGGVARSQLVVVRPGFVKAPFVRVYKNPDGSSYVRAPFVSIGSAPPRFWRGAPMGQPTVARRVRVDMGAADWRQLRRLVRDVLPEVNAGFQRTAGGTDWRVRLGFDELSEMVAFDGNSPLTPVERAEMSRRWPAYEQMGSDANVTSIVTQPGFRQLTAALRELLEPPVERLRRQALEGGQLLMAHLGEMLNGDGWQEYLAFPSARKGAPRENDAPGVDRADWSRLLERFEQTALNPDYGVIVQMDEFQSAHRRVALLVSWLRNPPESSVAPMIEELPPGQPELPAIPVPPQASNAGDVHSVLKVKR